MYRIHECIGLLPTNMKWFMGYSYSAQVWVQSIVMSVSVCLSVCLCLSACISQRITSRNLATFSVHVVSCSSSVRFRRRCNTSCTSVLWMTSYFSIMAIWRRDDTAAASLQCRAHANTQGCVVLIASCHTDDGGRRVLHARDACGAEYCTVYAMQRCSIVLTVVTIYDTIFSVHREANE